MSGAAEPTLQTTNSVKGRSLPRWRTDAFLAAAIALNYGNRGILPVVFPAMRAELHLSDVAFGLLGSLFFWSYAICAPVGGILGDRYSRRLLVITSVASWSITALLCGAATGVVMLAVIRVTFGIAESFYLPAAVALQGGHHGPGTRTFVMGLNKAAQSAGVVLGAAAVGWIAERWGWRSAFAIPGAIGLALALASPWLLSEPPASPRSELQRARPGAALAFLIRNGTYLVIVSNEMLSAVAIWMLFSWMPLFLYETYGVKMAAAGLSGMAMLQLSQIFGTISGTALARRLPQMGAPHRMRLFAACGLVSSPCLLCFHGHPSYALVTVAVSTFSFFRGWGGVYELAILCDVVPPSFRSMAVGVMVAAAMAAGGTGVFHRRLP